MKSQSSWFLFQKVSGFYPLDTFIVQRGYVSGKNAVFDWRFKNIFFYFSDGFEHSFRGLADLEDLKKFLNRSFNKRFIVRIGKNIRTSAVDFLRMTIKTFRTKKTLERNFYDFCALYECFLAVFQLPQLAQYLVPHKDKKLLYQFGISRDYAAKVLAKAENIYRPRIIRIVGHKKALFLMPHELTRFFRTGKLPSNLSQRKTWGCLTLKAQTRVYWNRRADKLFYSEYLRFKSKDNVTEISGLPVFPGKVSGKVFIALNDSDFRKIPKKAILVCSMTRYTTQTYLKNVSAIVTDGGGITCHAAIMAREFKVPTIVNTQNGTDVFKTGDLVEVDATSGIIRKI